MKYYLYCDADIPNGTVSVCAECGNCFDTCNGIIKVANALGGPDNISVCVSYLKK